MAPTASKRQQERHERALQDLIVNAPGNGVCADCSEANPDWASHNLGVFVCVRCASHHRSLGTHISKVKSVSMDLWTSEQVETMKQVGNIASNHHYNPQNVRPNIPSDADMVESAMGRYIRQKYQYQTLAGEKLPKQHTGSTTTTTTSDDNPVQPPPRSCTGNSLRVASSTFPMSRKEQAQAEHPVNTHLRSAENLAQARTDATAVWQDDVETPQPVTDYFRPSSPQSQPLDQSMQRLQIAHPLSPISTGSGHRSFAKQTNPFMRHYTPPLSPAPYQSPTNQLQATESQRDFSSISQNLFLEHRQRDWYAQPQPLQVPQCSQYQHGRHQDSVDNHIDTYWASQPPSSYEKVPNQYLSNFNTAHFTSTDPWNTRKPSYGKNSILAFYGPVPSFTSQMQESPDAPQPQPSVRQTQRSVTLPTNLNPFASANNAGTGIGNGYVDQRITGGTNPFANRIPR